MDHNKNHVKTRPAPSFLMGVAAALFAVTLAAVLGGFEFSTNDTIVNNPGGDARGLARTMAVLGVAPPIEDAELAAMIDTLRARAAEGDVAAARFVAELARLQRDAAAQRNNTDSTGDDAG